MTIDGLKSHYRQQLEDRLKLGVGRPAPGGLVFTQADSEPCDPDGVSKAFDRLISNAKVTPITLHGLGHTHISHLLMDGIHPKVVSERAGHASVNVTMSIYAAFLPNMQADAAMKINAWLR